LAAAKDAYPDRSVVALFQPHLYSRTQRFAAEFADALMQADRVVVTDVYPAREEPIKGVTGKLVADKLIENGHGAVDYIPRFQDIVPFVAEKLTGNELVITLGAGNIYLASNELLNRLTDREGGQ